MAPSKKRQQPGNDSPAVKKPRTEARPAPAFTSALQSEEVDFPRGGGTSLTALEVKQTRAEGARQADAEMGKTFKKKKLSTRQMQKAKKEKATAESDAAKAERDKDTIRVEELSYKRLVPGTLVLARVHTVLPLHLVVSMPNNLLGHIPITEVSNTLTAALNADIDAMSEDEDEEDEEKEGAPELTDIFRPGQYIPTRVINTFPTASQAFIAQYPVSETTRLAARVELTAVPEKINLDVAKQDVEKGYRIVGEVLGAEDKGYRVGLGLSADTGLAGVEGFIPIEEVEKNAGGALIPGQLIPTVVSEVKAGGRVVKLTLDPQTLIHSSLTEVSNIGSLLPGQLASCLVTAVVPSGLNVKICGFYDGTIDIAHLGLGEDDIEDRYNIGKKIKARILYDTVASSERRFALSALPHIFNLASPVAADGETPLEIAIPVGKTLPSVKVIRVIPDWGRVPTLSNSTGQFKVGTYHRARVIGHSPLDGVMLLSFEEKVLNQVFMQVGELTIGQVLKGTVRKLSDKGLFVNVQGNVDGVVWPLHYADIRLKHPEKRFKVGASVKARVFAIEPARNRVVLTLKKSLVESDLPVPGSFADVTAGEITPAVVSKILDKGCIVDLFGGLRAFVPQSEASTNYVANLNDVFFVGKAVNVRITDVDEHSQKLVASVRQALPTAVAAEKLEVGSDVSGIVAQIHAEQVVVTLIPSQLTALLSLANLSNHRGMGVDELRKSLKVGEKLEDLVVVSKNATSGLIIVANKRAKKGIPTGISTPARNFDAIAVGDVLPGRVISKTPQGAMVRLGKKIRGRVAPTDASDDLSAPGLKVDDDVLCCVLKVDAESRAIDLSTRKSRVQPYSAPAIVDAEINSTADLKAGQSVRGIVKNVAPNGLFVALGRSVTARVMIKELFDDFVKDWKARFAVGDVVSGKILSVGDDRVEMTLRTKPRKAGAETKLTLADFKEGQKVEATVKRVESFGLFLRIDGSDVSGLCHRSEISDNKKQDVSQALKGFREKDHVRAVITSIDKEKGKINFSIKASHFSDDFGDKASDEEEKESGDEEEEEEDGDDESMEQDDESFVMPKLLGDSDDESPDMLKLYSADAEMPSDDEEEDDDEDEDEEPSEDEEEIDTAPTEDTPGAQKRVSTAGGSTALSLSGFDWNGNAAESDSSDSDSESDEEAAAPKKSSKKKTDLTAAEASGVPQSASDFERALLASPNSSFLWIQYMSFQLQLHEIEKARSIGRQALDRIAFREEGEKLNVWMALVNLELGFGTPESTDKVLKQAAQYNDAREVYMRYVDALVQAGKDTPEVLDEVFKRLLKKYSAFPQSWLKAAEASFRRGDVEGARSLLSRALQSLDKAKHVQMLEQFALLELKYGQAERAKTLFEQLVSRYPKRLDVWNVYVDQLTKLGDIAAARNLIQGALGRKLTMKRAKFIFKKWLAVENKIGDRKGQENAKEKAREWVAAHTAPADGEDSDEEEEEEEESDDE
ncbi:rRNA processing-related protein [Trichosporon asahii var. asahii CBS 2479]|uniref:rRNA processing-related protein n=1 Tax=Trichosporon asahii var. asahii (strain ATCC 90039 / CBS 2479 / JCM 2466 / KCTC 7840 / NBRC 103889/ NCYC 2677 / UAMH 7654) TaxID=1186058 RepID=J6EYD3_TRIAS|nr:rRNA processing-related protein [Trichosporon asahii var. asahii CBS 2479]EJT49659.1 rRNA processing-related protein [Trichosporon asahii var. asahii CBS 2479]